MGSLTVPRVVHNHSTRPRRCGPSHPRARSSRMAGRYRYRHRPAWNASPQPNTHRRERPHNTPHMRRTGGPAPRLVRDRSSCRCEGFHRWWWCSSYENYTRICRDCSTAAQINLYSRNLANLAHTGNSPPCGGLLVPFPPSRVIRGSGSVRTIRRPPVRLCHCGIGHRPPRSRHRILMLGR